MKRSYRGFTLIEVIIVVVIIALLTAIAVVVYNNVQRDARDTKRKNDAIILKSALRRYYTDHGEYPAPPTCIQIMNDGGRSCELTYLESYLIPRYLDKLPTNPNPMVATHQTYMYARFPTDPNAYGIAVIRENLPTCKFGDMKDRIFWGPGSGVVSSEETPVCEFDSSI